MPSKRKHLSIAGAENNSTIFTPIKTQSKEVNTPKFKDTMASPAEFDVTEGQQSEEKTTAEQLSDAIMDQKLSNVLVTDPKKVDIPEKTDAASLPSTPAVLDVKSPKTHRLDEKIPIEEELGTENTKIDEAHDPQEEASENKNFPVPTFYYPHFSEYPIVNEVIRTTYLLTLGGEEPPEGTEIFITVGTPLWNAVYAIAIMLESLIKAGQIIELNEINLETLRTDKTRLELEISEQFKTIESLRAYNTMVSAKYKLSEEQRKEQEEGLQSLRDIITVLSNAANDLESHKQKWESSIKERDKTIKDLQKRIEDLKLQIDQAEDKASKLGISQLLNQKVALFSKFEPLVSALSNSLQNMSCELQAAKTNATNMGNELKEWNKEDS